jgi:hypothetical protein
MMRAVIDLGYSLSDISFMPEDFEELSEDARSKGVTVVPDMGVAPGMSNFLMGRGAALLDEVERAYIYVGGIPKNPQPPFNYQVTWSARDVIEEFTNLPVTLKITNSLRWRPRRGSSSRIFRGWELSKSSTRTDCEVSRRTSRPGTWAR